MQLKQSNLQLKKMAEGSTGQTELNKERLKNDIIIEFPLDLKMQKAIADICVAFDSKIDLNNRLNGYLAV